MATRFSRQVFVPLPLLRAIEGLPESVAIDGALLRFTGEVTSAPIVVGFSAYRAFVEVDGHRGWVDLSSASSSRADMALCVEGLRPSVVEQLVLALRAAMAAAPAAANAGTDERIDVCQIA